jgi:predicted secreted protein
LDDRDNLHLDDRTVREPQSHLGAAGQRASSVRRRRSGLQQSVEFTDSLVETGQFVSALNGVGSVSVIADGAAVVSDFTLEAIAAFSQPRQLCVDAIS